ncbi:MAG: XRE family transcriptional regulator [bacterium]|nr:XRE family transcriptional regulator [bacterium]
METIGERIRWARKAARLSLRQLAQRIGVSYESVRKYEQGVLVPSSEKLLAIARTLDKPVDFFRMSDMSIGTIEPVFRGHSCRTKRDEETILAQIRDWLERYLTIEGVIEERFHFRYPEGFPRTVRTYDEVEAAAEDLRQVWGLGIAPIANLTATVEAYGIRVGEVPACEGFDACAFYIQNDENQPVIVVRHNIPGDRQRFSLAHALGHILLRPESPLDEEQAAHRFAAALLVPRTAVDRELKGFPLSLARLHTLKCIYGMSMQAWLRRAYELGYLDSQAYKTWKKLFRANDWYKKEPGWEAPPERPPRLKRLVLEAYERELITSSRASQLLGVSLQEFIAYFVEQQGDSPLSEVCLG